VIIKYRIEDVRREVPWAEGFLDVVAQRNESLFVFECKRVDDKSWVFLISDDGKECQTRCRLEWFNGSAPMPNKRSPGHSRVFCCEYNVVEPSLESEFADAETEKVFRREFSRRLPQDIQRRALRQLIMLDNARTPPQSRQSSQSCGQQIDQAEKPSIGMD